MDPLEVTIDVDEGTVYIYNNGRGINLSKANDSLGIMEDI